jgi:hypothetical protein
MVEYGNAVDQGSRAAGGGGGSGVGGGGADLGAGAVNFVNDTVHNVQALPPEMLLLLAVVILGGLYFLKRAL